MAVDKLDHGGVPIVAAMLSVALAGQSLRCVGFSYWTGHPYQKKVSETVCIASGQILNIFTVLLQLDFPGAPAVAQQDGQHLGSPGMWLPCPAQRSWLRSQLSSWMQLRSDPWPVGKPPPPKKLTLRSSNELLIEYTYIYHHI